MRVLICLAVLVVCSGCVLPVSTIIVKTAVVRKDADGNVVETVITETITQNVALQMIEFEYIKLPKKPDVRILSGE